MGEIPIGFKDKRTRPPIKTALVLMAALLTITACTPQTAPDTTPTALATQTITAPTALPQETTVTPEATATLEPAEQQNIVYINPADFIPGTQAILISNGQEGPVYIPLTDLEYTGIESDENNTYINAMDNNGNQYRINIIFLEKPWEESPLQALVYWMESNSIEDPEALAAITNDGMPLKQYQADSDILGYGLANYRVQHLDVDTLFLNIPDSVRESVVDFDHAPEVPLLTPVRLLISTKTPTTQSMFPELQEEISVNSLLTGNFEIDLALACQKDETFFRAFWHYYYQEEVPFQFNKIWGQNSRYENKTILLAMETIDEVLWHASQSTLIMLEPNGYQILLESKGRIMPYFVYNNYLYYNLNFDGHDDIPEQHQTLFGISLADPAVLPRIIQFPGSKLFITQTAPLINERGNTSEILLIRYGFTPEEQLDWGISNEYGGIWLFDERFWSYEGQKNGHEVYSIPKSQYILPVAHVLSITPVPNHPESFIITSKRQKEDPVRIINLAHSNTGLGIFAIETLGVHQSWNLYLCDFSPDGTRAFFCGFSDYDRESPRIQYEADLP